MTDQYTHHPITGALMSVDRTIRAVYDRAYVARYEKYPEARLSKIRADLVYATFPELYGSGKSIMDVGFGTGAFLREMRQRDGQSDLCGYDVSPYPAPDCAEVVPNWQECTWGLITFFDSLEHFDSLDWLYDLDADRAIVSVPWYHPQLGAEWFKNWKHRRPGEHLWHFTPETLMRTMALVGLYPVHLGHGEDVVRWSGDSELPNILTMAFRR